MRYALLCPFVFVVIFLVVLASACRNARSSVQWVEAPIHVAELVRQRESAVWEALKEKDKSGDAALLANDFVGLYKDGFGSRAEHVAQIDDKYQLSEFRLDDVRVKLISEDVAIIMYRASCRATGSWAADCAKPMYISSIWVNRAGNWINIFSQDTQATK